MTPAPENGSSAVDEAHAADEPRPEAQAVLDALEAMGAPSIADLTPEDARERMDDLLAVDSSIEVASVEDRRIDGPGSEIPIRIYDPSGESNDSEADDGEAESRPAICFFHGGGWVLGDLESADPTCRKLATETGYPVVSVEYRLAPEHPFPAGLEDCYATLEWVAENAAEFGGDPDQIVLAGDSAGGNLAAGTCLLTRYRDGPDVAYQVLVYPVTGDATETAAYEENAAEYGLTADESEWFRNHYFEREIDAANIFAAPRLANDRLLSELPPATILTAGFDLLRDDGAAYADRLEGAGVTVSYRNYPGMIHGFFGMLEQPADLSVAHEAHADVVADLRDALE
ncbi:alpha/beta hydrolase [Natronococcus pandeyae]|uniref:Alpha/beta hydrolase n=1 Tax=Natronococcus pandeyae TaxID=2055836 RepID=A0A8J8TQZ2_9EURY|nr:alpha/beta hydrolase [Natronococcus pandeyae]TYL39008.1 alpha/beta hydrolase [Natronococcus pandeyae]